MPDAFGASTDGRRLDENELRRIHGWWRAVNFLSVGQIYLLDNPLLRRPLAVEDVKTRLLGHWGTTPGLNSASPGTPKECAGCSGNSRFRAASRVTRRPTRPVRFTKAAPHEPRDRRQRLLHLPQRLRHERL